VKSSFGHQLCRRDAVPTISKRLSGPFPDRLTGHHPRCTQTEGVISRSFVSLMMCTDGEYRGVPAQAGTDCGAMLLKTQTFQSVFHRQSPRPDTKFSLGAIFLAMGSWKRPDPELLPIHRPRCPKCHVWTAPAVQEESDISAKRSGAAMYPAFECSRYGRWP
jgi:hypothetical protein